MKTSINEINSWMNHLNVFTPCRGAVVVGSGYGGWAEVLSSLYIENAIFIEADISKLERMQKVYPLLRQWHAINQAVGSQEGEKEFYTLSNSSISGFLPSEDLQHIWPNLKTLQSTKIVSKTLQSILKGKVEPSLYNWLIIECFGSLEILGGASSQLDDFEVIMVRIIDKEQAEVEVFLEKERFSQMVSFEETNPQVNFIIYKRDINVKLSKEFEMEMKILSKSNENLTAELQNVNATFKTENETLQKQLEESVVKNKDLTSGKEKLLIRLNDTTKQLEAVSQENEENKKKRAEFFDAKKQQERKNEILKKERDSARKAQDSLKEETKYSSDAKIDKFINDIAPFFSQKAITYVDVGAFEGEVFMKLKDLKQINIREAHLFEPNPLSYDHLLENIKPYPISSLHSYNIGIGKEKADVQFSSAKSMTKQSITPVDASNSLNTFECSIVPLNDFFATITEGHIHLLKVDVEGNELNVLAGASEFLQSLQIDMIYLEVGFNKSGTQQTYFCAIDEYLQNYGYRVFEFYEQTKEWIEDSPVLRRCNVAYISKKFADANPYKLTLENNRLKKELDDLKQKAGNNK